MTTTRIIAILCACCVFYAFGFVTGVYQARQLESGAYRHVQSKPEPLEFSVCSLCLRPFGDRSHRVWKHGSRDIVWETK